MKFLKNKLKPKSSPHQDNHNKLYKDIDLGIIGTSPLLYVPKQWKNEDKLK
jgi:hypothetical protein